MTNKADIKSLIDEEKSEMVADYGDLYHSSHEAYAVLKDEVEEAEEEMDGVKVKLGSLWQAVRKDSYIEAQDELCYLYEYAMQSIAEMVQVCAVCEKAIATIDYLIAQAEDEEELNQVDKLIDLKKL